MRQTLPIHLHRGHPLRRRRERAEAEYWINVRSLERCRCAASWNPANCCTRLAASFPSRAVSPASPSFSLHHQTLSSLNLQTGEPINSASRFHCLRERGRLGTKAMDGSAIESQLSERHSRMNDVSERIIMYPVALLSFSSNHTTANSYLRCVSMGCSMHAIQGHLKAALRGRFQHKILSNGNSRLRLASRHGPAGT